MKGTLHLIVERWDNYPLMLIWCSETIDKKLLEGIVWSGYENGLSQDEIIDKLNAPYTEGEVVFERVYFENIIVTEDENPTRWLQK